MVTHLAVKNCCAANMPLRRGMSGKLRFVHAPYTLRPRVYIAETVDFSKNYRGDSSLGMKIAALALPGEGNVPK